MIDTAAVAQDAVCSGRIVELRIGGKAVRIEANGPEPVVALRVIDSLPVGDFAGAAHVQIVVIAAESGLAIGSDKQIVSGSRPENVVAERDSRAGVLDMHRVAGGLVDRVDVD